MDFPIFHSWFFTHLSVLNQSHVAHKAMVINVERVGCLYLKVGHGKEQGLHWNNSKETLRGQHKQYKSWPRPSPTTIYLHGGSCV